MGLPACSGLGSRGNLRLILAVVIPAAIGVGLEFASRPEPDCSNPLRYLGQSLLFLALLLIAAVLVIGGLIVTLAGWRRRSDPLRTGGPLVLAGISLPAAFVVSSMLAGSACPAPDPGRAGEFVLALETPSATTLTGPVTCYAGDTSSDTYVRADEGSTAGAAPADELAVVFFSVDVSDGGSTIWLDLVRGVEFAVEYRGPAVRLAPQAVRFTNLQPQPVPDEQLPGWATQASGELRWSC